MKPQFPKLKIKIKSLAAESQIIRKEERATIRVRANPGQTPARYELRLKNPRGYRSLDGDWHIGVGDDLYFHRTLDVRHEQRASLLAYGFLRGVPYRAVEPAIVRPGRDRPDADWNRVRNIVLNFGSFGSTKAERDKVAADIVAWRAVPALPRVAADLGIPAPVMIMPDEMFGGPQLAGLTTPWAALLGS